MESRFDGGWRKAVMQGATDGRQSVLQLQHAAQHLARRELSVFEHHLAGLAILDRSRMLLITPHRLELSTMQSHQRVFCISS